MISYFNPSTNKKSTLRLFGYFCTFCYTLENKSFITRIDISKNSSYRKFQCSKLFSFATLRNFDGQLLESKSYSKKFSSDKLINKTASRRTFFISFQMVFKSLIYSAFLPSNPKNSELETNTDGYALRCFNAMF